MAPVNAANQDADRRGRSGLNFWQWLGILIIALGVILFLWRNFSGNDETPTSPEQQDQSAPVQAEGETGADLPTTR